MNLRAAKSDVSSRVVEAWLFFLRNETKVTKFQLRRLTSRNEHSKERVVAAGGPVVSVTTYGERLSTVHLALESIAAGSVLPSRLILWVDSAEGFANRSAGLKRLVERGLEIYLTENFGPHTKYYPYLLSTDTFDVPLVTADDDLLYSRWWLEGLVRAHRENPEGVNCYRAHRIGLGNGAITPYQTWESCRSSEAGFLHFGTGVSGCIYPMSLLKRLKLAGAEFMQLCPKADDVWLHVNALRAGMKTRQIWNRPLRFPFVPGTQGSGLYHSNVLLARNDEQIRSTYTAEDIAVLEAEESSLHPR
ncbi:hypothetical protein [Tunturiibacter gelidiferens]|uniref:Glycosyltransferase n=1 Tax=Tunturiibacter gelidiferens TaxID=3069689 RepID=A0AAU7YXI3_9BACT